MKKWRTFTITISEQAGAYVIQADDSRDFRVPSQPFSWDPTPKQQAVVEQLRSDGDVRPEDIADLGTALYDAVFTLPNGIGTAFGWAKVDSKRSDEGLRLVLHIDPQELASLPWEAMRDEDGLISARPVTPFVRSFQGGELKRMDVHGSLRMLFLSATPDDHDAVSVEQTVDRLKEHVLNDSRASKRLQIKVVKQVDSLSLNYELGKRTDHVVLFAGHGETNEIILQDGTTVGPHEFADVLGYGQASDNAKRKDIPTRLIFLMACNTGSRSVSDSSLGGFAETLARSVRVPAVIAMQTKIADDNARRFATAFFTALARFEPVDAAMAEARQSIQEVGRDAIAPVLYLHAIEGNLFRKTRNWTVWALIAMLVAVSVTLALGVYQRQERIKAELAAVAEKAVAAERKLVLDAAMLGSDADTAFKAGYPQRSLLLSLEGVNMFTREGREPHPSAVTNLRNILQQVGGEPLPGYQGKLKEIDYAQDSQRLFGVGEDEVIRIWNFSPESRAIELVEFSQGSEVVELAVSQDGNWLAAITREHAESTDGLLRVWRLENLIDNQASMSMPVGTANNDSVQFSADGRWLSYAPMFANESVLVWDTTAIETNQTPLQIRDQNRTFTEISISPDSKTLAVGDQDGCVTLYALPDLTQKDLPCSTNSVYSTSKIAFSPDSRWLLTQFSPNNYTVVWDLGYTEPRFSFEPSLGHNVSVSAFAFDPHGLWLATAGEDGAAVRLITEGVYKVRIWDLRMDFPQSDSVTLLGHSDDISDLVFSRDGEWLASTSNDGATRLWDLGQMSLGRAPGRVFAGNSGWYEKSFISSDNRYVAATSGSAINLWFLEDGLAPNPPTVLNGHDAPISEFRFLDGAEQAITWDADGFVRVWDLADPTFEPLVVESPLLDNYVNYKGHDNANHALAVSHDGKWLAVGSGGINYTSAAAIVYLWRLTGLSSQSAPLTFKGHTGHVNVIVISNDGRWMITAGDGLDDSPRLWNLRSLRPNESPLLLLGHRDSVTCADFSSDDRFLITGSKDGTARVWNMAALNPANDPIILGGYYGHGAWINDCAISPDSRWVATAGEDATIRLWDLSGQRPAEEPYVLSCNEGIVREIAFSPDGELLMAGVALQQDGQSNKTPVCVWNLGTTDPQMLELLHPSGPMWSVRAIAFSPDGKLGISAHSNGDIWLWDQDAMEPFRDGILLKESTTNVEAIAVSADSRWLLVGTFDGSSQLWDLTNPLRPPVLLTSHHANDVDFTPDIQYAVTTGSDGTTLLWTLDLSALIDKACRLAGRNLTIEEWREYLGETPYRATCSSFAR